MSFCNDCAIMKNNLEEALKEKMSIDMSSTIKFLRTMRLSHYEIPSDFFLDMHDQLDKLEQELQKTREQLTECNELLIDVKDIFQDKIFLLNINDSCFSRIRRWNKDSQKYIDKYFKDKQGE